MSTTPRTRRPAKTGVLAAGLALLLAGCATLDDSGAERSPTGSTASGTSSNGVGATSSSTSNTTNEKENMMITITVDGQRFDATLSESAASRDLVAQLPLTIDMADHGSVEKTGALPAPLSLEGQPQGADPDVGDVGYYAPGHDLVLYYGDQSYFAGIVVLGRLEGDAAARIAQLDGSVTVTVASSE